MTGARRNPIFGVLAVIAPLVGFFFWWRIESDETAAAGDYTGLGIPLAIVLCYAPCLLLSTLFAVVSFVRRESPKQVAWSGLGIAWAPVVFDYLRTHLFS
jgi:uncharacterized membrane protein